MIDEIPAQRGGMLAFVIPNQPRCTCVGPREASSHQLRFEAALSNRWRRERQDTLAFTMLQHLDVQPRVDQHCRAQDDRQIARRGFCFGFQSRGCRTSVGLRSLSRGRSLAKSFNRVDTLPKLLHN